MRLLLAEYTGVIGNWIFVDGDTFELHNMARRDGMVVNATAAPNGDCCSVLEAPGRYMASER